MHYRVVNIMSIEINVQAYTKFYILEVPIDTFH